MSSVHLSAREVELLYLGCASGAADLHAAHCEPCSAELLALRGERDALLGRLPPQAYARRLQREHQRAAARRRWLTYVSGSLAVAAGVTALLLRAAGEAEPLAWVDTRAARSLAAPQPELASEDFLAKGDTTLLVVRKRGAEVSLLTGSLRVAPGDEIRIRFVCRGSGRVVAGVLTDAGGWLPLVDGEFAAGVHTPEATLRVTEEPGAGLIVLGTPEAVAAARAGAPAAVERARLVWTVDPTRHGDEPQRGDVTETGVLDAPAR